MSERRTAERELREEIHQLREELERLSIRVDTQELRINALSQEREGAASPAASALSRASSFDLPASFDNVRRPRGDTPYPWNQREQVARDVGYFIRRCLAGENRGASGRSRLPRLQNQIYLVVRDYQDRVYRNPVRVFRRFSEVRELCQHEGYFGDSIFVGLPTEYEARIAAQVAGLHWPVSQA